MRDEPVLMIRESRDYTRFKFIDCNRPINENNVAKIAESIRTCGYIKSHALIVNEQYHIFDGQHRFEACKMLNLPIYYVVDPTLDINVLRNLNVNRQGWKTTDHLSLYCSDKYTGDNQSEYIRFRELAVEYSMFNLDGLTALFAGRYYPGGANGQAFKNGKFTIQNEAKTRELLDYLLELRDSGFDLYNNRKFLSAMGKAHAHPDFDLNRFATRFKTKSALMRGRTTQKEYMDGINEIYNFNLRKVSDVEVDLSKMPRKKK